MRCSYPTCYNRSLFLLAQAPYLLLPIFLLHRNLSSYDMRPWGGLWGDVDGRHSLLGRREEGIENLNTTRVLT